LIVDASLNRSEIDKRFELGKTLTNIGRGLQVTPSARVKTGLVTSDGTIVVGSEDPPAIMFFTPVPVDGNLQWTCRGVPEKYLPQSCKGD